jgi:Ca2+-binding EF-hand superfamily protein
MKLSTLGKLTTLSICLVSNSGCMMAARAVIKPQRPDPGKILDTADTNGDGLVSQAEFLAAEEHVFARIDRNGDGFFDTADLKARLAGRAKAQERVAEFIARLDRDGDGRISKAEFLDGATALFRRADANHDGLLDKKEVAEAKKMLSAQREP